MEALITGTNTRVMWERQSRTREAPTGQGAKMEAAAEQEGAVCVCAENTKNTPGVLRSFTEALVLRIGGV